MQDVVRGHLIAADRQSSRHLGKRHHPRASFNSPNTLLLTFHINDDSHSELSRSERLLQAQR